jgi:hypothetical protein
MSYCVVYLIRSLTCTLISLFDNIRDQMTSFSPKVHWEGVMKSLIVAVALVTVFVPNYSLAQGRDDCWGPAQLRASAPDAKSRDSITMLSDEDTAILLAAAANHHNHPVVGIETIYSARYSGDAAKVLVFAFSKNCLVDRGAIPIDEWEKIFGPGI